MKPLKPFEDFLKEGIAKKQSPDIQRSKSLIEESDEAYKFLMEIVGKIGISDSNSNYIVKNAYDIIMELVRAKMLASGYSASGSHAHEAEVSYLREIGFPESDVQFANTLRYFRNGITYYGTRLDRNYAKMVIDFLENILPKLEK